MKSISTTADLHNARLPDLLAPWPPQLEEVAIWLVLLMTITSIFGDEWNETGQERDGAAGLVDEITAGACVDSLRRADGFEAARAGGGEEISVFAGFDLSVRAAGVFGSKNVAMPCNDLSAFPFFLSRSAFLT